MGGRGQPLHGAGLIGMSRTVTCVTLNLFGAEAPLGRRMDLILAGLRALSPDIVALQEVRGEPGSLPNQAETLGASLGLGAVFAPSVALGSGNEGVAVLSRLPIRRHEIANLPHGTEQERRVLLSVELEAPLGALWVHTTHLNYRLHHGKQREDQVVAVEQAIAALSAGPDVPDLHLLMGDFNAVPDSDEIRWLCGLTTLGGRRTYFQDAWRLLHPGEPGLTWARANPLTERLRFLQQDRRLDYIFVSPIRRDGRGLIHECRVVLDRPGEDGVFPSDHFGVLARVQVAPDGEG